MTKTIIRHLKSALVTFVGFFIFAMFSTISQESFVFSKATLISASFAGIIAGIRASAKILIELGSYLISVYKKTKNI